MKRTAALLLQIAVCFFGLAVLVFLIWEPHVEGRNAHATVFEIYFKDPFLAYVYAGSVPFFIALYGLFLVFGRLRKNQAYSQETLDALLKIQKYAMVFLVFVSGGAVFIVLFGDKEDRPPGLFLSFVVICGSGTFLYTVRKFRKKMEAVAPWSIS